MRWLIIAILFLNGCVPGLYGQPVSPYYWPQPPLTQQLQQQEALGWQNYYQMQRNQQLFNINQNLQGMRYGY